MVSRNFKVNDENNKSLEINNDIIYQYNYQGGRRSFIATVISIK